MLMSARCSRIRQRVVGGRESAENIAYRGNASFGGRAASLRGRNSPRVTAGEMRERDTHRLG